MDDWNSQFTANLAADLIGFLVSALVVAALVRIRAVFSRIWRHALVSMKRKPERAVVVPNARQVKAFARHSPVGEAEFRDAIDYLKGHLPGVFADLRKTDFPDNWFGRHLTGGSRYFQFALGTCAVAYLASILAGIQWLQVLAFSVWLAIFAWILLSLGLFAVLFYLDIRRAMKHQKQLKAQISQAMSTIAPSVSMTYSQIGQFTRDLAEHELPIFQAEMAAIGLPFHLRDLELARFLANASADDVERIGLDIAKKAGILEQIPIDKRSELAGLLVNIMRETEAKPVATLTQTAG